MSKIVTSSANQHSTSGSVHTPEARADDSKSSPPTPRWLIPLIPVLAQPLARMPFPTKEKAQDEEEVVKNALLTTEGGDTLKAIAAQVLLAVSSHPPIHAHTPHIHAPAHPLFSSMFVRSAKTEMK